MMTALHSQQSVDIFYRLRKPIFGMAVMMAIQMTGCSQNSTRATGRDDDVARKNLAAIVTEDAQAALIGQHIMQMGGNAVDATVASAFALTVTMPSRAALSGGGICLVHDPATEKLETLDFLPRGLDNSNAGIPAMARGLYALHARYGKLRFEQLVAPAEKLARFDGRMARGLAADLAESGIATSTTKWAGKNPGDAISDPDTANLLAQIRNAGTGKLYQGVSLDAIATATGISAEKIRNWVPSWHEPQVFSLDSGYEQVFASHEGNDTQDAAPGLGLVAKGPGEQATACMFTRGALFGAGPDIAGFGTAPARATGPAQISAPGMMINPHVHEIHAAWAQGRTKSPPMNTNILYSKIVRDRAAALDLVKMPGGEQLSLITCVRDVRGTGRRRCSAAIGASRGGLAGTPE